VTVGPVAPEKGHRYVAFLRAINAGGRVVKMAALKRVFERLKLADVETFIASGNVIFTSALDAPRLERLIEGALEKALGYPVVTFLRTTGQVAAVAAPDPLRAPLPPGGRTYVGFLPGRSAAFCREKGRGAGDADGPARGAGPGALLDVRHPVNAVHRLRDGAGKGARTSGDPAQREHRETPGGEVPRHLDVLQTGHSIARGHPDRSISLPSHLSFPRDRDLPAGERTAVPATGLRRDFARAIREHDRDAIQSACSTGKSDSGAR
jgi:hypothetical protein